jgi:hypothetical protein
MLKQALFIPMLLAVWPAAASDSDRTAAARAVAGELVQRLGAALRREMAASGPDGAVAVCKDTAPQLAAELSRRTGWRVARVSLKPRNALLGSPDAWEQSVLLRFEQSVAAGEPVEGTDYAETVQEPQGRFFRYMRALSVQPLCLTCHGSAATIPEPVRRRLADEYPHDRAVGYDVGQLRGAVTIKFPVTDGN